MVNCRFAGSASCSESPAPASIGCDLPRMMMTIRRCCRGSTYIQIGRGFLYFVAIMDWASRAVLTWRLSNTMDVSFYLDALEEEALARFGTPEIFNTDQGSQFTSSAFTGMLADTGIRISMDGRGLGIRPRCLSLRFPLLRIYSLGGPGVHGERYPLARPTSRGRSQPLRFRSPRPSFAASAFVNWWTSRTQKSTLS
jgi:hypothetical protein